MGMEIYVNLWYYLAEFFFEWKMFHAEVVEKIKTHISCPISFFFLGGGESCHLWDNVEKCGRAGQAADGNIIRRTRFACWIHKATNTHSEYVIIIVFPLLPWLTLTPLGVTLYLNCLSCFCSQPDDRCVLSKACSWFYMIRELLYLDWMYCTSD